MPTVARHPAGLLRKPADRLGVRSAGFTLTAWARVLLAMIAAACSCSAFATDDPLQSVAIEHAFARATPPGATAGGIYFTVVNSGSSAVVLTGVSSTVAANVELHRMMMDNGIMKMRAAPSVQIGAHASVALEAAGYHVMLMGLRQPLKTGDRFPLVLTFDTLGTKAVSVSVEPLVASVAPAPPAPK